MDIKDLKGKVPQEMIDSLVKRGISSLTPPQQLAVEYGITDNKNFIVAAPTASGKTLVAEIAMLNNVLWKGKKAVYIAPMKALVREKYIDLKKDYPFLKIAMSIGDLDSLDKWLAEYDIILASTEKFDSLIRHGLGWLEEIGCIIVDEVHMLDDPGRGPTLEILVSKLMRICTGAQIIALSATISNSRELAGWMSAEVVESNYRPVVLERGIELMGNVSYDSGREEKLCSNSSIPEIRIAEDTIAKGKQAIAFYSTKRNAEAGAERLAGMVSKKLQVEDKKYLEEISEKVLGVLGRPTMQCERLAKVIRQGTAFHHSGLVSGQKELVEEAFKENRIKAICSTTTLGLGVNLPAQTVIVRDVTRYGEAGGSRYMGINEVTQLFGRAGRPKYDSSGRALLIARSKAEAQELYNRYMLSDIEPVTSKLGVLPALRTHVLTFIATRFLTSEESIMDFMSGTLYGYQYSDRKKMQGIIHEVLEELERWKFISKTASIYSATRIGSRVSELYIDPLSARWMLDVMPKLNDEISILFMISNTAEMRPYVRVTADAEEKLMDYIAMIESSESAHEGAGLPFYDPVKPFSTALMLNDWIGEKIEREIIKDYGTTPGTLFAKVTNADWLLYAGIELAKLSRMNTSKLLETRIRVKYGIRKELLDLVRLEQVGRVRARTMYSHGITKARDIRRPEAQEAIRSMFGSEIAARIISQVIEGGSVAGKDAGA